MSVNSYSYRSLAIHSYCYIYYTQPTENKICILYSLVLDVIVLVPLNQMTLSNFNVKTGNQLGR